ncbi:MAG: hypothetical protein NWQ54_19995 [Paraglaciecola sp.]|uniref:hypothetical protein n=1 Tax=Paraglaciecola sp. TaxID=1920173 RepID=UPI00273E8DBF|nr:hypothetical protein [Paraglaciecola sp.]MDP5031404.1 hypothetical protein [Paraglaciecola sp.]MDP5133170.1 hypothetical protein [Paraglaciecola sp.]
MLNRLIRACLLIGLCINNANAATTEVKGLGAIVEGNISDARKNALEDAKRLAVEQLLGSYISARTETNNFMLASEKIYSTVKGHLDSYEMLEEGKIDSSTYFVKIKANINDSQAIAATSQELSKFNWYKQPTIAITTLIENGDYATIAQAVFKAELTSYLKRLGFNVIDSVTTSSLSPSFIISSSLSTNISRSNYQDIELHSNQISVATQLLNARTGNVLSTSTEAKQSTGVNSLKVLSTLAEQLAQRVSQRINLDTKIMWLNNSTQEVLLNLDFKNHQEAMAVEAILSDAVVGLSPLQIHMKELNKRVYLTEYQGWSEQLYAQLNALSLDPNIPFIVSRFNGSEITLSSKH